MTIDEFWTLIDTVGQESGGDMDRKCKLLRKKLVALEPDDLRKFIHHFDVANAEAYTWPLWGAAYVMHGGCSDDSFMDFRATLVSQGSEVYHAALKDPESLADLDFNNQEAICYEGYQYVPSEVAEELLGGVPEQTIPLPADPAGTPWDEDAVEDLFPRLAAKYRTAPVDTLAMERPWWKFW